MKMTYEPLLLTLSEPFTSHKGMTDTHIRHILVKVIWDEFIGYGIAIPAKEYGMTEKTLSLVLDQCIPLLSNITPFQYDRIFSTLSSLLSTQTSALAAIDMAILDILGKYAHLPLRQFLKLDEKIIPPSAISVSIMSLEKTLEKVHQYASWPILKLKMSQPNIALIKNIRNIYDGRIWIDGNGAWNPEQAIAASKQFFAYGVELIEQPIPPGFIHALRSVRKKSPIPIIADEDCRNLDDIFKLEGCADGINIKLLKCGGLSQALEMIKLARRLGLKIMLGCKTESVLGITAIAQLADLADFLDLDGHLDMINDPFKGITLNTGQVLLLSTYGLGASVARTL